MKNQAVKLIFRLAIVVFFLSATNIYAQRTDSFSMSSYYKLNIARVAWDYESDENKPDDHSFYGVGYGLRLLKLGNVFNFYGEGELNYNKDYHVTALSVIFEFVIYDLVSISVRPSYGVANVIVSDIKSLLIGLRFRGIERWRLEFGDYEHNFTFGLSIFGLELDEDDTEYIKVIRNGKYLGLSYLF